MTLGKGITYCGLCKQKLNAKSSTKVELITIDDAMGQILWTCHSLATQVSMYQLEPYTKTIKAQSNWQKIGRNQAVKGRVI